MKDFEENFKKSAQTLENKLSEAMKEFIKSTGLYPNIEIGTSKDHTAFQVKVTSANTIGE